MHAERAQYGTFWRNVLYRTCIFCTYIFWCQLTHLHVRWVRSLEYYCPNARTLKVFLTHQIVYCDTLWHNRTNVRILPDGKELTCRMPYRNTVRCYLINRRWWYNCWELHVHHNISITKFWSLSSKFLYLYMFSFNTVFHSEQHCFTWTASFQCSFYVSNFDTIISNWLSRVLNSI